ncbi:virulence factor TspB C-terminal domain-related protein [Acinetobacter johnsonii]|uniref:virulence factor TspB C-terminal domain-related protein n=1 Tax=Acinetobacter johnsonii TaxID=40214 RepID=UPI00294B3BBA|nr:virulence factor TspB C-terminal domain-related protein [Acinetobacter johnsonii]
MVSYSKFLKVLLSFSIALSPVMFINSANASTLAGGSGWRVASTVANGIGVTVNGVKDVIVNGASKTVNGVANVTPTAGQVGKFMGKNLGAAAVIGAMDLLLDGVDYVMDPANNSIRYKVDSERTLVCGTTDCIYRIDGIGSFSSPQEACSAYFKSFGGSGSAVWDDWRNDSKMSCVGKAPNGAYAGIRVYHTIPTTETDQEEKTIPLVNLGSRVLEQAETEVKTGNPAVPIATPVTQAAATAVVGEAATDETQARPITAELDKSSAISTDETATGEIAPPTTNPDTGEVKPGSISLDFPVFCSWAPSMCVLADKVQEAITDAREWVKESEATDTELEFPEQQQEETDTNINFNGSCPAKITLVNFNYHNNQQNWEVDFTEWCSAVTTYIRPIVISMGAFSAVLIVSGVRINE